MKKVAGRRDKYPEWVHQSRFTVPRDPNQGWRCSVSALKGAYGSAKYHLNDPTLSNSLSNTEMSFFSRVGKNISYFTTKTRGQLLHPSTSLALFSSTQTLHIFFDRHSRCALPKGLDWTSPDWTGLDWKRVDWSGLHWTGLDGHSTAVIDAKGALTKHWGLHIFIHFRSLIFPFFSLSLVVFHFSKIPNFWVFY